MKLRPPRSPLTQSLLNLSALSLVTLSLLSPPLAGRAAAQLPQAKGAQQPTQSKPESEEEKAKARKELERRALVLLEESLQGAQALKLAENRAAVRAQAAELFWERDEKRARSLFREAAADLSAAQAADGAKRERGWMLQNLRARTLYAVASHDPQFALELLRDSRPPADASSGESPADPGEELRMEQSLVALAADSDPKAALRMAEESLSKGVTFGVFQMLERLKRKDAAAATRLAGEIVAKLRSDGLTARPEAVMVALSLLRNALRPQLAESFYYGGPAAPDRAAEKPKPLVMEDSDLRELSELVASAALGESAQPDSYGLLMQLRPVMPELEKRVPARAAQLRQRMAEYERTLDPRTRAYQQLESSFAKPPEAMLEDAAKAPAEVRGHLYSMAAAKLAQAGETERARQVVADNLRGQERDNMLAMVERSEVARAVEKGDTEGARLMAARIKSKERRAAALSELAVAFAAKGDRKGAAQLLEEARSLLDRQPDNEREVEALLEVARGYAMVEPAKTFEMIDPLIDQANDMMTAAALLEKFGAGGGLFRKGEMQLSPLLEAAGGNYARYIKALSALARVDFERTKATADRFNRDEVRLAARLVVARSVLTDPPDPPDAARPGG
jgi:hypothetical protein